MFNIALFRIQIPLGVQLHNEQKTSEMVEIMAELHKYVPMQSKTLSYHEDDEETGARYEQQSLHRLLLGGDQLTCARARSAQRCRMNSECDSDALLGFIPCCEDWHAKVVLLTVSVCMRVYVYVHYAWLHCMHFPVTTNMVVKCIYSVGLIADNLEAAVLFIIFPGERHTIPFAEYCASFQCIRNAQRHLSCL